MKQSYAYDLIYANTQKALVVGAISSAISRRPLVYHLHDILSLETTLVIPIFVLRSSCPYFDRPRTFW